MGQKVNPVGMRIGISRDWNSKWFANSKDFSTFVKEDYDIRAYLSNKLKDAFVSHVEIDRAKGVVTVLIFAARTGVVLGQDGANVKELQKAISKIVKNGEVKISVVEVKNPGVDANIVALEMAQQLEARASFRNVQKKAIQKVRKAGAKGCRTMVSGRLGGADIARSEGYKEGIVPLTTLRSDIDYAHKEAVTPYGRLGVKVWICKGEILDDAEKGDAK